MAATIDFGIDLGTTNSSIASCRVGVTRIYQSAELMDVTPSVVYLGRSGRMLVGKKAYDTWVSDPQNTHAEFKRWMGFSDRLSFPASAREMTAEELSAEVLKALRSDVARATGEDVAASVITVPAAFGSLQCEATARAARLAGLAETPLLQEPIAAAIAYGASAAGKGQRWMVFDLGGGTLDIAVVSTRNGRLAVLDHQGNNRLGGKDMDRLLAQHLLLSPLAAQFALPDKSRNPQEFDRLFRALVRIAEQTKIALSTRDSETVEIFNIGNDLAGKPIEATLSLSRVELEKLIEPLVSSCVTLCKRALEGARISGADLDRLILVGGPSQMPLVRAALSAAISSRLDFSIDPMTVVARGAAIYAGTLERKNAPASPAAPPPLPVSGVQITLNYERASGTAQSPVAGVVASGSVALHEVRIDAEGGFWSSGWMPLYKGRFVAEVTLDPQRPVTRYTLAGRGPTGESLTLSPAQFAINFMLPMAAPPLPHTIAVELVDRTGRIAFDPVFPRHSPLPAEARRTYRADRTLRPSEIDTSLPIKFWEIDVSEDPHEKWWAGCVHIRSDKIRRPITEGSEIELVIKIDASRKIVVEAFVPSLNQGFNDDVFVPDPPSTRGQLQEQLDLCFERVSRILKLIYAAEREDLKEQAQALQIKLESIAEQIAEERRRGRSDPDAELAPNDSLRKIRMLLAQLEKQLESEHNVSPEVLKLRAQARWTRNVVDNCGSDADKQVCSKLEEQLERYAADNDPRGLKFVREALSDVCGQILWMQPWYWANLHQYLKRPGQRFVNKSQADQWLAKADNALERKDLPALRTALIHVCELQPPDQVERAKEQAIQSGLTGA